MSGNFHDDTEITNRKSADTRADFLWERFLVRHFGWLFSRSKKRILIIYFLTLYTMYPYSILNDSIKPFPILGEQYYWAPYLFDFIEPYYVNMPVRDVDYMNEHNMKLLKESGKSWGVWWYLDDRSHKLIGTNIYDEWRVFHLGIDLMTQWVSEIYNPLDGEVYEIWYEERVWNYGVYIIMRYSTWEDYFYALFGHMDRRSIDSDKILYERWGRLGTLWRKEQNGNWVPHLHLQVFTGKDFEKWKFKWYCTLEDMRNMQYICPHPGFLLHYNH